MLIGLLQCRLNVTLFQTRMLTNVNGERTLGNIYQDVTSVGLSGSLSVAAVNVSSSSSSYEDECWVSGYFKILFGHNLWSLGYIQLKVLL